jgi:hypothetical protein
LIFKRLKIFCLTISMLLVQVSWAIDRNSLSETELLVVKKLGISESDLAALDKEALKDKLQEKFNAEKAELKESVQEKFQEMVDEKIEPRLEELKSKIEKEKDELKKDAKKLAAGYLTSTVSLFAATLIAPQVIMVCRTKPSAVIYAGTAGVYVLQEMLNMKVLKASQLAEIEMVTTTGTSSSLSLKENAKVLEDKVDEQVGYLVAYKNTLDHAVKALKKKAKNAKLVSIGFLAASATAAAEQLNFISGGGACVVGASSSPAKINFSLELDQKYMAMLAEAKTNADKWAVYYEWESMKFGVNRTITPSEYNNLQKIPVTSNILIGAMNFIQSQIVATAFAEDVKPETKKVTVAASLKDNKAADWLGDLDKLGIAGGLATNIVAYMTGWQMGFLTSVISSGTSRSITFGAQGALALTAGKLFDDAANSFGSKLDKIDQLIKQTRSIAVKGIKLSVPSDSDARNLQEIASKMGVYSEKLISEMSIDEAKNYIGKIKQSTQTLDDKAKALVDRYQTEIKIKIEEKKESLSGKVEDAKIKIKEEKEKLENKLEEKKDAAEAALKNKTSFLSNFIDFLIPRVEAQTMPNLVLPKFRHPNTKSLNDYLELYENYYKGLQVKNPRLEEESYSLLEKNKSAIENYRQALFKKALEEKKIKNTNYADYENAKINEEKNKFAKFYDSLPAKDQLEMNGALNPASGAPMPLLALAKPLAQKSAPVIKKASKLNEEELSVLNSLINRLMASEKQSLETTQQNDLEYNLGNTSIHPKDVNLFDIVHARYLRFMEKNYSSSHSISE